MFAILPDVERFGRSGIRMMRALQLAVEVTDHRVGGTGARNLCVVERRDRLFARRHVFFVRSMEEEKVRAVPRAREAR